METEYHILKFADDTVLVLEVANNVDIVMSMLKEYGDCSGLRINKSKTEMVQLGLNDVQSDNCCGIQFCEGSFRYLGIWFSHDPIEMEYKNYRHRIEKTEIFCECGHSMTCP